MKKMFSSLATSLLVLGLLTSCGDKSTSNATTKAETKEATNKVLNVMFEVEIESLDPQIATDGTALELIANFTDGLKQMRADGSTTDALCAGETISDDGLTYTFKIREDAVWSNGEPVTADDFVFGWRRAADPKIASEYAYMLTDIGHVKNAYDVEAGKLPVEELGVKALDSKTLQVELEVPVSYFDSILYFPTFYPVNQAFYEKCGDKFGTSADTVLSNGAYILTDYQPAALNIKLEKNDKYYDADRVKLDGINYQVLKDSQQALMNYQSGELDLIKISGDQVDQVQGDPEFQTVASGFLWYICPNISGDADLGNLNMRLALTNAINRKSLVENVVKDGSEASYVAVPSGYAFNANGEDFTTSQTLYSEFCSDDKAKAVEYFNKAKAELGKDSFTFEFLVDDTVIQQNVAAVIKEQIESTLPGVKIDLHVEPKKQRLQDMRSGNYQLGLTRWGPDYADPMTYLELWIEGNANNWGNWSNPEYNSIISRCKTGDLCQNLEGRWAAMKEAEKYILSEAVIFPVYQQSDACMIKSNVKNVDFHAVALLRVYKDAVKE